MRLPVWPLVRTCACGILVRDGRLLLGLRTPHRRVYPGRWDVIGGGVEPGETLAEALRRELREEIGVVPVTSAHLCDVVDAAQAPGDVYAMFRVDAWTGEPALADDEHTALAWFTVAEACALPALALPEYRDVFRRLGP